MTQNTTPGPTATQDVSADEVAFTYLATLTYGTPQGQRTSTRTGMVWGDPQTDTRTDLIDQAVGCVKRELGLTDGAGCIIQFIYLERDAL